MIRSLMKTLLALLVVVIAVVVVRTMSFVPAEKEEVKLVDHTLDLQSISQHMAEAIRYKTISFGEGLDTPREPFEGFIGWLAETYPQVHDKLSMERLGDYSLLYKWQGSSSGKKPIMLTGHYDVVPVPQATRDQWEHAPFSGDIDNTHVWGRGALDDKSAVIAMMEAVTLLLEQSFTPQRDIYIAFGHDEEVGGDEGAARIVDYFKQKNIQLAWTLDEGSFVLDGIVPGLDEPMASINLSEKGYLTIEIIAKSNGGHASMPPENIAIYSLVDALTDLHNSPFQTYLDSGPSAKMYAEVALHLPFVKRMLFANKWMFGSLLKSVLVKSPAGAAMLRTTIAPTMLRAGIKENVLAPEAIATINLRIHPQDDVDDVVAQLRQVVERDGVSVKVLRKVAASPVSSDTSEGFLSLVDATKASYGSIIIAPGLTIAATDSKHYQEVADDSYRFNPMMVDSQGLTTFHGVNERISIENLQKATGFYMTLIGDQ